MKSSLSAFARTLPIVAAIAASAALVCTSAAAAHGGGGGGGGHGGGGGWHGGGHYHGGHWGYGGYYWPGAFWGGVAIGVGVGYYGGYYGYYGYPGYYGGYYAPYYPGYYSDPSLAAAPAYGSAEPGAPRSGQPVPQAAAPAEPIFYPRNGQSAETTESDRRECNRWATTQRGAMDDASIFQRATFACMEGRGYTAR
jgi:hypothetical protein